MPKRTIKRFLPDYRTIREHKHLSVFGERLHDPNLWHLNRGSVSGAFSVGLLVAFVPIPFQMVLAAAIAIVARVNLPVAATLVWVTNPLTMPPLFYSAYKLGAFILNETTVDVSFELSVDWLMTKLGAIWEPFLLGCFILGVLSAIIGNLVIRALWRMRVLKDWKIRREKRRLKKQVSRKL